MELGRLRGDACLSFYQPLCTAFRQQQPTDNQVFDNNGFLMTHQQYLSWSAQQSQVGYNIISTLQFLVRSRRQKICPQLSVVLTRGMPLLGAGWVIER